MPPLPNVPKVLKVALRHTDGINVDIVTRFFIQYSGTAPGNTDLDTFCGAVHDAWNTNVSGNVHENIQLIEVEAIDLTSATSAAGTWSGSAPGTATGAQVPIDAAVVSSYIIGRRYRGGHPRGYWPLGISADLETPQTWTATFIANVHDALSSFFTTVRGDGWSGAGTLNHVNVSYFHGFTVVTDPSTGRARNVPTVRGTPLIDTITSRVERIRIGTQRRRLQY